MYTGMDTINTLYEMMKVEVSGEMDGEKWLRKALELNESVVSSAPAGFGFGSYVYRYGMIIHASFLPNALHNRGLLPNLLLAAGARASAMEKELTD